MTTPKPTFILAVDQTHINIEESDGVSYVWLDVIGMPLNGVCIAVDTDQDAALRSAERMLEQLVGLLQIRRQAPQKEKT